MIDKIIQIVMDVDRNIVGLGESGRVYYVSRLNLPLEWKKYIDPPELENEEL